MTISVFDQGFAFVGDAFRIDFFAIQFTTRKGVFGARAVAEFVATIDAKSGTILGDDFVTDLGFEHTGITGIFVATIDAVAKIFFRFLRAVIGEIGTGDFDGRAIAGKVGRGATLTLDAFLTTYRAILCETFATLIAEFIGVAFAGFIEGFRFALFVFVEASLTCIAGKGLPAIVEANRFRIAIDAFGGIGRLIAGVSFGACRQNAFVDGFVARRVFTARIAFED